MKKSIIKKLFIKLSKIMGYEIIDQKVYVYMVKQWRYPVDEWLLEFPAGTLNDHEDPNKAVKRELQEEIGMVPQDIKLWSPFYVAPGWCTEKIYCFFVTISKNSVATVKSAVVPGLIPLVFNFLSKTSNFSFIFDRFSLLFISK